MNSNFFQVIIFFICIFFIIGCAGQYPPPGGPLDTKPPEIIYTYPEPNTLNFRDNKILLEFSEYIDQRSVQEAIFISPHPGELEFDWSGKKLMIIFSEKLKDSTTYVFILGTDAKDLRGNRLAETFSLAFSTAANLDSCSISGKVFTDKPEAVKIFAYKIHSDSTMNLDLRFRKPDYLSQTAKNGSYIIKYLSYGTYILFAVKDVYSNFLYDSQVDAYGVTQSEIVLSENYYSVNNINFRLTYEDTSKPFISNVKSLNKNQVLVNFNEPVKDTSNFIIINTLNNQTLDIKYFDKLNEKSFLIYTADQDSVMYKLIAINILDTAENKINPETNFSLFYGTTNEDNLPPSIEYINVQNNVQDVEYEKSLLISFSESINKAAFERSFEVKDSIGNPVKGKINWLSNLKIQFLPEEKFKSNMQYTISIQLDSVYDINRNTIKDSLFTLNFITIDNRKLSSIKGVVKSDFIEKVILEVVKIDKVRTVFALKKLDLDSSFVFENIPEGKYIIEAYIDKNDNYRYDYGKIFPLELSEHFTVYPDTINLRARWPIENVVIRF